MKNKIVIHFYVKESWKDKNGFAPIYLRITINGERAEISTNRKINSELWDKTSQRVAGRNEPARIINTVLNNLVSKVEMYFSSFDVRDEIISVNQIIAELKGSGRNQMTLIKAFEYHNSKLEELSGIEYSQSTINKYGYAPLYCNFYQFYSRKTGIEKIIPFWLVSIFIFKGYFS